MFGLRPKLPVTEEERLWVDNAFHRLSRALGRSRMLDCDMVQPTDDYFPDPYDGTESALEPLIRRVCGFMRVDPSQIQLAVIPDSSELVEMLPEFRLNSNDPAGLHFGANEEEHTLIGIKRSMLKDPLAAVATLAHELGHVILLGGGHLTREIEDMEPMTDLVTVYLGLGLFTANAARRFHQFQDDRRQGWSMKRLGYLPEVVFGYALARFARERGEGNPDWTRHLSTNLKAYFRQSVTWLQRDANETASRGPM
jgi:hypothetical protein